MAETALKFGPEWLRNLSNTATAQHTFPNSMNTGSGGGGGGPKYKLADFRYGREEMLALFDDNISMPDSVKELTQIMSEKCQKPLALVPMSDDEQRMWARSVNSEKFAGKGTGGPVPVVPRTRGGSVDRGRGRGRGTFYQRGSSFDDIDGPPGVALSGSRPRGFERSQSIIDRDDRDRRFPRSFPSRVEENGLVRKEGWRSTSREASDKQDEGGWSSVGSREKWGLGKGSWRGDRDDNDRDPLRDMPIRNGPAKSAYSNRRSSQLWDDDVGGDQLPEWSTENDCDTEQLGTFDSAGAFLEKKENIRSGKSPEKKSPGSAEEMSKENIVPNDINNDERAVTPPEEMRPLPPDSKTKTTRNMTSSGDSDNSFVPGAQVIPPKITVPPREKSPKRERVTCERKPTEFGSVTAAVASKHSSVNDLEVARVIMEASKRHIDPLGIPKNSVPKTAVPLHRPPTVSAEVVPPPDTASSAKNWQKEKFPPEEENFALLEKATENMMAQWTAEDEHVNVVPAPDKVPALPVQHEEAYKWFYKDPQGEVQGPFCSPEMYEWFSSGYFTLDLLVRRGCDERFTKLVHLIETWGRVPFAPGPHSAPLRAPVATPVVPLPHQVLPSNPPASLNTDQKLRNMFMQQQLIQQQLLYNTQQLHMQQMLNMLKQQESFTSLSQQQQHQVLLQHMIAETQLQRTAPAGLGEIPGLPDPLSQLPLPHLSLTLPSLMKNDSAPVPPLWGIAPPTTVPLNTPPVGNWAHSTGQRPNVEPPVTSSIWDLDEATQGGLSLRHKSQRDRREKEEEDERIKQLEGELQRRRMEEEEMQRRRMEEERRKREEDKRKEEEAARKQREEEEMRRKEELRRQELEEEMRKQKEMEEEIRRKKEMEDLRRKREMEEDEMRRKREEEQLIRIEQQKKAAQEKLRKEEDQRQKELERQQRLEREKQLQLEHHMEQQAELERKIKQQADMERQRKQQEALLRLQQQQEQQQRAAIPPWAINIEKSEVPTLSLAQIQQREMERAMEAEQRVRFQQLEKENQVAQIQRAQQAKSNNLTWANRSSEMSAVKTLIEIQLEEAERAAKEEKQKPTPVLSVSSSPTVWNNAATNLTWASSSNGSGWSSGLLNEVKPRGFWDDLINTSHQQPQTITKNAKSGSESAFPVLAVPAEPGLHSGAANKAKNIRAKKEEETVIKLFETHTLKNSDDFTRWCTKAMSNMATSVDVPTFIAFLKDVECPYELNDYVRSYLGESKESQEFAKQFLERRSKHKNQSKQPSSEENMWGPAPAITPSLNKGHSDFEGGLGGQMGGQAPGGPNPNKAKKKKTKRMHKLDVSMLGFTVQSDPDRINIGEIDHTDGV